MVSAALTATGTQGRSRTSPGICERELRLVKYEKFGDAISKTPMGRPFEHYQECHDMLGAMVKFRCKKGCGMAAVRRSARSGSTARKDLGLLGMQRAGNM